MSDRELIEALYQRIEAGAFNERCRTFDKADAEFLITAARWFETFQEGVVKPAVVPKRVKVGRAK